MTIEEFIKTHTPLVKSIVFKSKFKKHLDHDDLSELIHVGLWKAWKKFDPERGRASTLITWTIRNMIYDKAQKKLRYLRNNYAYARSLADDSAFYQEIPLFELLEDGEVEITPKELRARMYH